MTTRTVRLLGLSGSLREASNNTAILRTLGEKLGQKAMLTLFPLNDIPLYNSDLDGEVKPQPVQALIRAIAESDGIVICSPEYNYGMSGVLKNTLDWASRPAYASPLRNKPVLIMTSSPAFTGGVRAQLQILETLTSVLARAIARPQIVIAGVGQKIIDGRLTDEANLKASLEGIDDLLAEISLVGNATVA